MKIYQFMYGLGFRGAVYKLAMNTQSGLYCLPYTSIRYKQVTHQ